MSFSIILLRKDYMNIMKKTISALLALGICITMMITAWGATQAEIDAATGPAFGITADQYKETLEKTEEAGVAQETEDGEQAAQEAPAKTLGAESASGEEETEEENTALQETGAAAEEKAAQEARIAAEERAAQEARAAEERAAQEARAAEEKAAQEARAAAEAKAAQEKVAGAKTGSSRGRLAGRFKTYGYSTKNPERAVTASGTRPVHGRTVGSDWSVLPKGTRIRIGETDDRIYVVEDNGNTYGQFVDIYYPTMQTAHAHGLKYQNIYIVTE